MYNGMPSETVSLQMFCHSQDVHTQKGCFPHEKRIWLWRLNSFVGSIYIPFRGTSFHMLLQISFVFNCFPGVLHVSFPLDGCLSHGPKAPSVFWLQRNVLLDIHSPHGPSHVVSACQVRQSVFHNFMDALE